ncbi:MAG: methylated-DNA--[protein]-cysteine S-methyltransferase [Alphaproteobacteria bacterium]|jgi:AraC family transcriptional regulator of adaptative response/methylated-DNA-[protein]-cysteine methyltransferase|nr:methylated-DNA--[protein]-cysteine S-methyltransferase [Alphaproteobacteria bacterium]
MEKITYGLHDTPLGQIVIAQSCKGLCWLGFMVSKEEGAYKGDGFTRMQEHFPNSELVRDDTQTKKLMNEIMQAWDHDTLNDVALDLRGTDFQCAVWKALLNIPRGQVISYGDVANDIGRPKASRAVGSAVGENPVSLIVPCHRVVQASGGLGNYGWGVPLKKKILEAEGVV